jgi:hypothetical protein
MQAYRRKNRWSKLTGESLQLLVTNIPEVQVHDSAHIIQKQNNHPQRHLTSKKKKHASVQQNKCEAIHFW